MIIQPHLATKIEIWAPRYHDQYSENGEKVVLMAKYKVDQAAAIIIVDFTKAKHLEGQRYAVKRSVVQTCPIDTNGKIACYAVGMSKLEYWETPNEVRDLAFEATKNTTGIWPEPKSLPTQEKLI